MEKTPFFSTLIDQLERDIRAEQTKTEVRSKGPFTEKGHEVATPTKGHHFTQLRGRIARLGADLIWSIERIQDEPREKTESDVTARPNNRPAELPAPTEPLKRAQLRSAQEWAALSLLNRSGAALRPDFSEEELKRSWRQMAMRYHPDRWHSADAAIRQESHNHFVALLSARETLMEAITEDVCT